MYQNQTISAESIEETYKVTASCPTWESIDELVDYGGKEKSEGWKATRDSREHGEDFTGTSSFSEACELATEGWPDGRWKVAQAVEAIWDSGAAEISSGKLAEYDVAGYLPDVPSYVAGDPCHMINLGEEEGSAPVIKILINISASCAIPPKALMNRAASLAALVDVIEGRGSSCEVSVVDGSGCNCEVKADMKRGDSHKNQRVWYGITNVKSADVPIDLAQMAFTVGHPSMLRRLMFAACEVDPFTDPRYKGSTDWAGDYRNTYGFPLDVPDEVVPEDCIYFSAIRRSGLYLKPESAVKEVIRLYNEQAAEKGLQEVGQ